MFPLPLLKIETIVCQFMEFSLLQIENCSNSSDEDFSVVLNFHSVSSLARESPEMRTAFFFLIKEILIANKNF